VSSDRIHISAAHRDDLAAIMALEGAGFPEAERWSERSWLGELLGDGRTVLIARAHAPVGAITVQTSGELADLHRLVVAPGYRRRGVGTQLTTAAVRAVRHLGARAMILEVDYTNDPAIALYARVGFEQLTARENYYGPGQHALIMKLYDLETWTGPPEGKP
jgi:[ribosomal protein S18]-alanine N-acetyltransferase